MGGKPAGLVAGVPSGGKGAWRVVRLLHAALGGARGGWGWVKFAVRLLETTATGFLRANIFACISTLLGCGGVTFAVVLGCSAVEGVVEEGAVAGLDAGVVEVKGMESCPFPSSRRHQELSCSREFFNVPVIQTDQSVPLHSTSCVLVRAWPMILSHSRASVSRILFRYLLSQRDS